MKRWQVSKVLFWEEAPFFRLLLPIIVAILCYDRQVLPRLAAQQIFLFLAMALLITAVIFLLKQNAAFLVFLRSLFIHLTLFVAGWFFCFLSDIRNDKNWFAHHLDSASAFEAKVVETPLERARTWKLKVAIENVLQDGKTVKVCGNALAYIYKNNEPFTLKQGDYILLPNKWIPVKNAGNPDEFDHARFCNRHNIYHQQFIGAKEISVYQQTPVQEKSLTDKTHDRAMQILDRYIKDTATLGLIQAMLLGDEMNFDPELSQSYVETGIIHIVAISGSHVMVFFGIISFLFFWLKSPRYEFIKYLISVPLVCFYVAVAGAPTSAVRAAIMFSFIALGLLIQKERQPLNQLFATAFFMLLYEPMWLFAVGFQLSFAAVLSLIIFFPPISKLVCVKNPLLRKLWHAVAASIAAEIIIAPLVIYYFHLLPVSFLVANAVAFFFMGIVLALGLALIAFGSFPFLATFIANLLTGLVVFFNKIVFLLQQLNPPSFKYLHLNFSQLVFIYIAIAGFSAFILMRQRKGLITGLISACILLSLLISDKWRSLHQGQFIVYNISHKTYAEEIMSNRFFPLIHDEKVDPLKDYATKEYHANMRAWKQGNNMHHTVFKFKGKKILALDRPVLPDSIAPFGIDFLLINYPLTRFNGLDLQRFFRFKKLIVTGDQERYRMEKWKDSCARHKIPAHFTMLDGAFVLK